MVKKRFRFGGSGSEPLRVRWRLDSLKGIEPWPVRPLTLLSLVSVRCTWSPRSAPTTHLRGLR